MRTVTCDWGNPVTGEKFYGVRAFVPGYGWLDVAVGGKPAIFKTPEARDALRALEQGVPGGSPGDRSPGGDDGSTGKDA